MSRRPELEPSVLPQLQATDDPIEKGFICLAAVARQIAKMRPWDELAKPTEEDQHADPNP